MCRPEKREERDRTPCYLNTKEPAVSHFKLVLLCLFFIFLFLCENSLKTLFNPLCNSNRHTPTYTAAMQLRGPVPRFLVLLSIALLLISGYAHAVPLSRTVGLSTLRHEQEKKENMQKLDALSDESTSQRGDFYNLVDEKCDDGVDVEECLKRRMMGAAHLDYIYTQEVKP